MNYDIVNLSSLVNASLDVQRNDIVYVDDFDGRLCELLRKTSHVEELVLMSGIIRSDDAHLDCAWCEPIDVPRCFLSSIENVTIEAFQECNKEMKMISYILKNAMVLKKLSIESLGLDLPQETNILNTLWTLPRSSSSCQVEYKNS